MAETDPQVQALQRNAAIESAFAVVFGAEGKRSAEQQIVWEHLMGAGFESRPIILRFDPTEIAANAANHDLVVKLKELVRKGSLPRNPFNQPTATAIRE